jgi:hypothetical protein
MALTECSISATCVYLGTAHEYAPA